MFISTDYLGIEVDDALAIAEQVWPAFIEWSGPNVSLALSEWPAWPAKPIDVAKPATRQMSA
jgi:hypothetical protein